MDTTAITSTVPSSIVTVTSYQTTVVSVQTSTTSLTGVNPVTVTGSCSTTTTKLGSCLQSRQLSPRIPSQNLIRVRLLRSLHRHHSARTPSSTFYIRLKLHVEPSRLSSACTCLPPLPNCGSLYAIWQVPMKKASSWWKREPSSKIL
jgi:hypothetical protein